MDFIKSIFTFTPQQQAKSIVQKYLSSIQLQKKHLALTLTFQYLLTNSLIKCTHPQFFMVQLTNKLTTTRNVSSTVKLFTVIHNAIYERDYNKEQIECLEKLSSPNIENQEQKKWFTQFSQCYGSYLKKLPSVCDIYLRAKHAQPKQTDRQLYLTQVFRIINQIGLLFPSICTFTNIIGRYYVSDYPEFPQFYRMLNKQITMVYNYLKLIIEEILSTFRNFNIPQLRCFIKTIPEIQLICDKMEDLLLNKYFKGKSIKGKIYFKEEKVQEIYYYLEYEVEAKLKEQHVSQLRQDEDEESDD